MRPFWWRYSATIRPACRQPGLLIFSAKTNLKLTIRENGDIK
jgi:hypothetical protein